MADVTLDKVRRYLVVLEAVLGELCEDGAAIVVHRGEPQDVEIDMAMEDVGGAIGHLSLYLDCEERARVGKPPTFTGEGRCGHCFDERHCELDDAYVANRNALGEAT